MKAEFFEQFKTVNDAATTAAASHFGAAQLHGIHAIAFEANIANGNGFTRQFFLRRCFDDGGTSAATKQQAGGVAFGIATNEQNFFTLLRHHVAEVGQREAFANAALAIDGNDLRFFGHFGCADGIRFDIGLAAQNFHELDGLCGGIAIHAVALQSRIILRQLASPKAVS